MNALFHAHSGLRFVVVFLAILNIVVSGLGIARNKPFASVHRGLGAAFAGTLHLQVLLGLAVLATRTYYPALIGHIVMMVLAAAIAQAAASVNRRRKVPTHGLPLAGVIGAMVCIVGGVMAIQRGLFTVTAF